MSQSVATRGTGLDGYFRITERGSTVRTEVIAGFTTFMTMAYILFLNPIILNTLPDRNGLQLSIPQLLTVTALAAGVTTLAMGLYANYPFAIAAGLGLNAVVTFQLVGAYQLTWPEAMGVVVLEGLIILILVLTKFRQAVMDAVPLPLKLAIGAGIGLFITIIGFVDSGFVTATGVPGAPLQLGTGNQLAGWPILVFIVGLMLIIWLYTRGVKGSLLIGILSATVLAVVVNELFLDGTGFGAAAHLANPVDFPKGDNFSLIGDFSLFGAFGQMGFISAALAVFTLMLSDFFDTMGTAIGLGKEAGLLDSEGRLPDTDKVLIVDSAAAAIGGAFSASSNTTYIESASGIADGGRTGLTAVVVGVLFLLSLFLSPLAEIIPIQAAAPALVMVGFLMLSVVREIPWDDLELAIPSFLTIVLMPFTYSITNGIGAGFVAYTFIKVARGKSNEVRPMMWIATVAFIVYFGIFYVRFYFT
ncbi:MAG: adenine/guanine/hypoxanthine permease [Actinomycetota bacterium]|nr:adenine/guanine/hypoxanthine permease [Actinomycetota bacterium]